MQFQRGQKTQPTLALFDEDLLVEYIDSGLTTYDVSNPFKPRKVGFTVR